MSQKYKINVNGRVFEYTEPKITGQEVLTLIGLHNSADYELLLQLTERESEPVELNEVVTLKEGSENFISVKPYPEAVFELDDECYPFSEIFMTPAELMGIAGLKENEFYLKQLLGHKEITYKNDQEHVIALHDHIKFVSCKTANTTVS